MPKGQLRKKTIETCPICGTEFLKVVINQKYCCESCKDKAYYYGKKLKEEAEGLCAPPRYCKTCGKRLDGRKLKFCDTNCKNIYYGSTDKERVVMKDDTTVNESRCECTRRETCFYGIPNHSNFFICGYILLEGHSRPGYPDGDKCEYYKPRPKGMRRRKTIGAQY